MITGPRKRPTNPNDWMPPRIPISTNRKGNSADPPISAGLNEIVTDQQRPRAKDKQCSRHQQCAVLKRQGQGGGHQAPATLQVAPSPTPWFRNVNSTGCGTPVRMLRNPDDSAFCDRSRYRPVHGGAGRTGDLADEVRPAITEQAVRGHKRAICQPCPVAQYQKTARPA